MRKFLLYSVFSLSCLWSVLAQAQVFQNTAGTTANDFYWQGLALANGNYIAVGHTNASAPGTAMPNQLLLTEYAAGGTVNWSRKISIPCSGTTTNCYFEAYDISIAPASNNTGGLAAGYYITGQVAASPNVPGNMFVMRVDNLGALQWIQINLLPTLNIQNSYGVAVVTEPTTGGVIAVGNAGSRILVASLSSNGGVLWSNIYGSTSSNAVYIAREATLAHQGLTCTTPTPTVMPRGVVITGETRNDPTLAGTTAGAGTRTLVMAIDGMGIECWRRAFPAMASTPNTPSAEDSGYDITYDLTAQSYIVVGKAVGNTLNPSSIYVIKLSTAGAFNCGTVFNFTVPTGSSSNAFARAVAVPNYSAPTVVGNKVLVAGPNIVTNNSFLMEVNYTTCPMQAAWSKEYPLSDAVIVPVNGTSVSGISESISPTGDNSSLTSVGGYFLTTNTQSTASTAANTHVIRTDNTGYTLASCPPNTVSMTNTSAGTGASLLTNQISDNSWSAYQVANESLTLTEQLCSNTPTDPCIVDANFTATLSGSGTTVYLQNTSTYNGTPTCTWTINPGGTTYSGCANFAHTFTTSGLYTICLTVTNTTPNGTTCTDTYCSDVLIQVANPNCIVNTDFCYSVNGSTATFTNNSTGNGTLSYYWDFGDLTYSTATNPSKTYSTPGTYNVCLRTINTMPDGTSCCQTRCRQITIAPSCSVTSNFRFLVNGTSVTFYNMSTSATGVTYLWTFGNGSTSTAYSPPTQTYNPGTYTACLEVTRVVPVSSANLLSSCSKYLCKTIVIDPPCTVSASFRYQTCIGSNTVNFTNLSGTNTSNNTYLWEFGDGTSSTLINPSHTYANSGLYNVCLTTTQSANCKARRCYTINLSPATTIACRLASAENHAPGEQIDPEQLELEQSEDDANTNAKMDIFNSTADMQLFPNPAQQSVSVLFSLPDDTPSTLRITDLQGKVVREMKVSSHEMQTTIDIADFVTGIYLLTVQGENGTLSTVKLVKQ